MRICITDGAVIDERLPVAMEHGLGIEVQEFVIPENLDGSNPGLAREIHRKIMSLPVRGMHGAFYELIPASRDPLVQGVARTRFEQAYDLAGQIGAEHLVLHTGFFPKTYDRETWIQNSVSFWTDFLSGRELQPQLHLENVYEDDHTMLPELVDRVNDALGRESVSVCLDIGHVNANSSASLETWIKGLGHRIKYTHLHNNDGVMDNHWGLWKGTIDIPIVLDLLQEYVPDAVWTIEVIREEFEGSVLWMKERGYLG